jgi:hypothetical protein
MRRDAKVRAATFAHPFASKPHGRSSQTKISCPCSFESFLPIALMTSLNWTFLVRIKITCQKRPSHASMSPYLSMAFSLTSGTEASHPKSELRRARTYTSPLQAGARNNFHTQQPCDRQQLGVPMPLAAHRSLLVLVVILPSFSGTRTCRHRRR